MDDEQINMLNTCDRLATRLTARERAVVARFKRLSVGSNMSRVDDIELRTFWDKVTSNGTRDT
jgi:hypothetical protein